MIPLVWFNLSTCKLLEVVFLKKIHPKKVDHKQRAGLTGVLTGAFSISEEWKIPVSVSVNFTNQVLGAV